MRSFKLCLGAFFSLSRRFMSLNAPTMTSYYAKFAYFLTVVAYLTFHFLFLQDVGAERITTRQGSGGKRTGHKNQGAEPDRQRPKFNVPGPAPTVLHPVKIYGINSGPARRRSCKKNPGLVDWSTFYPKCSGENLITKWALGPIKNRYFVSCQSLFQKHVFNMFICQAYLFQRSCVF